MADRESIINGSEIKYGNCFTRFLLSVVYFIHFRKWPDKMDTDAFERMSVKKGA